MSKVNVGTSLSCSRPSPPQGTQSRGSARLLGARLFAFPSLGGWPRSLARPSPAFPGFVCPPGTGGGVWRHFCWSQGQRQGEAMLPNILVGTGWPRSKGGSGPDVYVLMLDTLVYTRRWCKHSTFMPLRPRLCASLPSAMTPPRRGTMMRRC